MICSTKTWNSAYKINEKEPNIFIIKSEVHNTNGGGDTVESRGPSDSLQGSLFVAYGFATEHCRSDTVC